MVVFLVVVLIVSVLSQSAVYHRIADDREKSLVVASGQLWGRAPRMNQGNADPSVKAYCGPLPQGERGYTFTTQTPPSHERNFPLGRGVVWYESPDGAKDVPGHPDMVFISVQVIG